MKSNCKKFLHMEPDDDPVVWEPMFQRLKGEDRKRMVATVTGSGIDLILKLTENFPEPYGILYVLVVARATKKAGRYQSKDWLDRNQLTGFLERYRDYFECDGRHDIWVKCGDDSLIVYDRHELLYLYGNVDGFRDVLNSLGYREQDVRVDFPHQHLYNPEFDEEEVSIVESDDYIWFDLVVGQDIEADDPRWYSETHPGKPTSSHPN